MVGRVQHAVLGPGDDRRHKINGALGAIRSSVVDEAKQFHIPPALIKE